MDGYYYTVSSTYLVQKFALNSYHRIVKRKGLGRGPDPAFRREKDNDPAYRIPELLSGKKCSEVDLQTLGQHFDRYIAAVNLVLSEVYSIPDRASQIGDELDASRGQGYVVLRELPFLGWKQDNEFGNLVFERMHRNVLETAARIILSHHSRRRLVTALLDILSNDRRQLKRLMALKRIPADLIRDVRESGGKKKGTYYHYALAACRQVRRALDETILKELDSNSSVRSVQRGRVRDLVEADSEAKVLGLMAGQVHQWKTNGFSFTQPIFRQTTMEFAASTENTTGQGYWFKEDPDREDEIVLYIKTPPGITGHEHASDSPYRGQTIRFRFLDWLPSRAARARRKAYEARENGDGKRAIELQYRADRFEEMSQQLKNTIRLQECMRELSSLKSRKLPEKERISKITDDIRRLKESRRCAPPVLKVRGHRVTLLIPFKPPDEETLRRALPAIPRCRRAGVDRGLRYPIVLSVKNGGASYDETKIGRAELFEKRARLRQRTRVLVSQVTRRRNNWEKKRAMVQLPSFILKKERELEAVWAKVRRIDQEISHQLAAETVWFCEHRGVKTVYFEDLRFFRPQGGFGTHSWNLSTNLWGMVIEGVRYRREALAHRYGGVWTVNPAMTSQRCSTCGERGIRVRESDSTEEERGGEYFYCPSCESRLHADVNAARNIMMVQQEPSAVAGRTA
jgi:transposase